MDGILPMYKPRGITSFDVIRRVKILLPKGQKVGHAGTLDPFADGVLLLLLGHATKRFDEIQNWEKTYLATAILGASSDTLDSEGTITSQPINQLINRPIYQQTNLTIEHIQEVANKFVGEIEQTIPVYSAAKYKGKPLYKYARAGQIIPAKSKKVRVYEIKVESVSGENSIIKVKCGSGTYIRQLSYDIFCTLGIESYLHRLTRLSVGEITVNECNQLDSEKPLNVWEG